jgi:cytoskeletal protein RodZ
VELLEDDQDKPSIAVEPELRPKTVVLPTENEHGQSWPQIIAAIVVAIVLIVLLVLLARWVYHRVHSNSPTVPNTSSANSQKLSSNNSPAPGASPANPNSRSSAGSSSSNPGSPPSSSSSNNQNSPPANQKITNTGPGNVIAIFVGASLASAGLHFIINLRRANRAEF